MQDMLRRVCLSIQIMHRGPKASGVFWQQVCDMVLAVSLTNLHSLLALSQSKLIHQSLWAIAFPISVSVDNSDHICV